MTGKVYVGDIGTQIVLDCGQDISAATARSIEIKKPNGRTVSWPATASGTNAITCTTGGSNLLDVSGAWQLQAKVTLPSGTWRGETVALNVYASFG
jgi:hypothetical protein